MIRLIYAVFMKWIPTKRGARQINDDDLERIERLHHLRGVIVFTDPDYNGERIRKLIMAAVPTVRHAFLKRDEAVPGSKSK